MKFCVSLSIFLNICDLKRNYWHKYIWMYIYIRAQWDRCWGPKSSQIETGHLFSIVKLNFNVGFVDFRAYFGPFSLVNRDRQKMADLLMKMASNQKMQENKPTLKFNFTIEKRWPVSKFSFWHSHWALPHSGEGEDFLTG